MTRIGPGASRPSDDGALVEQVRGGDPRAFEQLVRRHLRRAHAAAYSVLGEDADAEDACQEAFLIALEKIEQCRTPENFGAWLTTIVRNEALGMLRSPTRRKSVVLEEAHGHDAGTDPLDSVFLSEARSEIGRVLQSLTELQRRVLVLHDLEGWRHGEIAHELGISAGSSRVHLFVARRAVRAALEHWYLESLT